MRELPDLERKSAEDADIAIMSILPAPGRSSRLKSPSLFALCPTIRNLLMLSRYDFAEPSKVSGHLYLSSNPLTC